MREIIDLLAQVVVGMSEWMEMQDAKLDALLEAMIQTRDAALLTQSQGNPELYGSFVGNEVRLALDLMLDRLAKSDTSFCKISRRQRKG